MEDFMKLSDKLIMLRKEKGWSQEDFAEKLDVSRQAISRWENESALPDAQNILQISKLFGVSADYLLNDECEGVADAPAPESVVEKATPQARKRPYLIVAICLAALLSACAIIVAVNSFNEKHIHHGLVRVIENKVAPTCTVEGSYEEVIYCEKCGEEVLRTHIIDGAPVHKFQDQKCIICGEDQRERD